MSLKNPNRRGSYKDSLDCIKSKKAAINPVNKKDNKFFQYAITRNKKKSKEIEMGRNKLSIRK